jgi:hypothetical protein
MRSFLYGLLVLIGSSITLYASDAPAPPRYQIYGGYTWLSNSFNGFPGMRQSLNGWDASVGFPPWHSLRFKIDVYKYSGTNQGSEQKAMYFMAGGQYDYRFKRMTLFGEGMMGDAGLNRNWGPQQVRSSTAAFAGLLGGGLDTAISRHFAYRVDGGFQYTYTSLVGPAPDYTPFRPPGIPEYFGRLSTGLVWQF